MTVEEVCHRLEAANGLMEDADAAAILSALPDQLLIQHDRGIGAFRRSLGRNLSRLQDRIFNGLRLENAGIDGHRKVRRWRLTTSVADVA